MSWSSKKSFNAPTVQREMTDEKPAPKQEPEEPKAAAPTSEAGQEIVKSLADLVEGKNTEEAEKKIETAVEEAGEKVTPEQLDALAEQLMPRIKRIMRSEMERTSYM